MGSNRRGARVERSDRRGLPERQPRGPPNALDGALLGEDAAWAEPDAPGVDAPPGVDGTLPPFEAGADAGYATLPEAMAPDTTLDEGTEAPDTGSASADAAPDVAEGAPVDSGTDAGVDSGSDADDSGPGLPVLDASATADDGGGSLP